MRENGGSDGNSFDEALDYIANNNSSVALYAGVAYVSPGLNIDEKFDPPPKKEEFPLAPKEQMISDAELEEYIRGDMGITKRGVEIPLGLKQMYKDILQNNSKNFDRVKFENFKIIVKACCDIQEDLGSNRFSKSLTNVVDKMIGKPQVSLEFIHNEFYGTPTKDVSRVSDEHVILIGRAKQDPKEFNDKSKEIIANNRGSIPKAKEFREAYEGKDNLITNQEVIAKLSEFINLPQKYGATIRPKGLAKGNEPIFEVVDFTKELFTNNPDISEHGRYGGHLPPHFPIMFAYTNELGMRMEIAIPRTTFKKEFGEDPKFQNKNITDRLEEGSPKTWRDRMSITDRNTNNNERS